MRYPDAGLHQNPIDHRRGVLSIGRNHKTIAFTSGHYAHGIQKREGTIDLINFNDGHGPVLLLKFLLRTFEPQFDV